MEIKDICWVEVNLDRKYGGICCYVIDNLANDLILGETLMRLNNVVYRARDRILSLKRDEHSIRNHGSPITQLDVAMIKHTEIASYLGRAYRRIDDEE